MADPETLFLSNDLDWLGKPDREVEDQWIERKQSFEASEIARQISSFANGQAPGGLIIVGVSPEGELVGLGSQRAKVNDGLPRIPVDGGAWQHRFVDAGGGAEILFIRVPFSSERVVCRSDGKAFARKGSSTVELSPGQLVELRYQRGEESFEDQAIVRYEEGAIDLEIGQSLLEGIIERNGLTLPQSLEEALANKGLTVRRGDEVHLTVAGLLAVGRKPTDFIPGAKIHFQRFEGTEERFGTERNITKERWFEGPTRGAFQEVVEFVGALVREFDYLGSDGRFVTEPEYPKTTWEEAIVNALVHRSYSIRNAPIEIRMFDDRFEVESPGGYPGPQRPDSKGEFPFSYPRNRRLGEALRYLGLVRLAKEGTRRMKEEMTRLGLPPPEYQEIQGMAVRVTLRNDVQRRRAGAAKTERWDEVLAFLQDDLVVYHRRAFLNWYKLQQEGIAAPRRVLDRADRLLQDEFVPMEEKKQILELLRSEQIELVTGLVKSWPKAMELPSLHWTASDPEVSRLVADLLSRSDDATGMVLDLLDNEMIHEAGSQGLAFETLRHRLHREPLPPKDWMQRALSACRKYPLGEAKSLYYEITGRQKADR